MLPLLLLALQFVYQWLPSYEAMTLTGTAAAGMSSDRRGSAATNTW